MSRNPFDLSQFLKKVGVTGEPLKPKTSLDELVRRGLVALYLKDTGKFGNPPTENAFWGRENVKIDARTAQKMEIDGVVTGRVPRGGIPSELQLTAKGVVAAEKAVGV